MLNQRHWLNWDVCTQIYALHIFYVLQIYVCINRYTFIHNPIITGTLHMLILSKLLFRYLNLFKIGFFSACLYIQNLRCLLQCRFYHNQDQICWNVLPLTLSHTAFAMKGVSFWLKHASNVLWYYRLSYLQKLIRSAVNSMYGHIIIYRFMEEDRHLGCFPFHNNF